MNKAEASEIWAGSEPVSIDNIAGKALRLLGLGETFHETLRYHPNIEGPDASGPALLGSKKCPATGVYGFRAEFIDAPRPVFTGAWTALGGGSGAVRLSEAPKFSDAQGVALSLIDGLAAQLSFGVPVVQVDSFDGFTPEATDVYLFVRNDLSFEELADGYAAARDLTRSGHRVVVHSPWTPGQSWADVSAEIYMANLEGKRDD